MSVELPEEIVGFVTLGGELLAGAWIDLRLPMTRKNDYRLPFGPTDAHGAIRVTRVEIDRMVKIEQRTGLMDYASLGFWSGEIVITPFNLDAVRRAEEGHRVWAKPMPEAYPPDFLVQMAALSQRLSERRGDELAVSAKARGAEVRLTCQAAAA